jgi:hypothetical protein
MRGVVRTSTPAAVALALVLVAAACSPPETQRVQGGGAGADIDNRSPVIEMHGGSVIYPDQRCAIQGEECTGPLPASGRPGGVAVSGHVLEHMGRGGAVRRVIYQPPPSLALPAPEAIEPPFPGPGATDG